jgi:DMSO/TMAO reductase YedYZ molybdopterin-dependent catalytic subunit
MSKSMERREVLKFGLMATGLLAVPSWAIPAMAQGETAVPFTDIPARFNPGGDGPVQIYDIRNIDGLFTPANEFFSIGHYGVPEIAPADYRLQVTGLVDNPLELTLDEIRARPSVELAAGYECSGNSPGSVQGLSSCGNWMGVRVRDLLADVGVQDRGQEVVFLGADSGEESNAFRQQTVTIEAQFGRSLSIQNAMRAEPILAYELNGEPLQARQGAPVRLIMPGWYGVANVKWLTNIHVQENRYVGHFQARWYRTVQQTEIGGEMRWHETEVSRMRIKSVIARVTRSGDTFRALGFVLNDGTGIESVEVQVDDSPWQAATLDPANTEYSWKLFTFEWTGSGPGEHTIVSRATDVNGATQMTSEELSAVKTTFLENNSLFPRTIMVA